MRSLHFVLYIILILVSTESTEISLYYSYASQQLGDLLLIVKIGEINWLLVNLFFWFLFNSQDVGISVVYLKQTCVSTGHRVEVNWSRRRGERGSVKDRCPRTTTLVVTLIQRDGCRGMRGARSARRKTAAWTKTSARALKEQPLELLISSKFTWLTIWNALV